MQIYGDIPKFHVDKKPLYDIGNGERVTKKEAVSFIINNYGEDVTVEAYNITSIDDEQDIFVFTYIGFDILNTI